MIACDDGDRNSKFMFTVWHPLPPESLSDPPVCRTILHKSLPLHPPALHLLPHVISPECLADPAQDSVVRLDEEVRAERGQDRLERGVLVREVGCEGVGGRLVGYISFIRRINEAHTPERPNDGQRCDDEEVWPLEE